jgi:hypothetical protein
MFLSQSIIIPHPKQGYTIMVGAAYQSYALKVDFTLLPQSVLIYNRAAPSPVLSLKKGIHEMEEPHGQVQAVSAPSAPSAVRSRLSIWQRLRAYSFKKLVLICAMVAVGLGIGIVIAIASVAWYLAPPLPVTEWQKLDITALSLRATLKTDWDGSVRYQFKVTPHTQDLIPAFDSAVQANRDTISLPVVNSGDRVSAMAANDSFLFCERSAYKDVEPSRPGGLALPA